jgi:hypothetical protein
MIGALNTSDKEFFVGLPGRRGPGLGQCCPDPSWGLGYVIEPLRQATSQDDTNLAADRTSIATGVLDEVTRRRRPIPNQALLLTTVRGRGGPVASATSCNLHTWPTDDP